MTNSTEKTRLKTPPRNRAALDDVSLVEIIKQDVGHSARLYFGPVRAVWGQFSSALEKGPKLPAKTPGQETRRHK